MAQQSQDSQESQQYTRALRLRLRYRYRFDRLVAGGTRLLIGWFALACLIAVVPVSAVFVWSDRPAPATLSGRLLAMWASIGQTLKIGGATGSPVHVLASVVLALIALLFVSTLVSLITTGIDRRLMALRLGHSTVVEAGHTVVLGWSDQVFPVLGELVEAGANQRRSAVAVLAPKDKVEMEEEIAARLPDRGRTRIICRNGSTTDPAALRRVSPGTAKAVLVLPPGGDAGDAQVVKTLLALDAAVVDAVALGEDGEAVVVAAVREPRHHGTASLAAGPAGHVLCVDEITARLLVQTARQPGLSLVYQELLDFDGDEFYTVPAGALGGRAFGEALLAFATSSVVGLLRADGSVALNPDPGAEIGAGDRIVVVSRDDDTAVPQDVSGCVEPDAIVTAGPRTPPAQRLLLLGWNRRSPLVVDQLDRYVGPGTTLDVVALAGDGIDAGGPVALAVMRRHLEVAFLYADVTDARVLAKLDVPAYDAVIVMGETDPATLPALPLALPSPTAVVPAGRAVDPEALADDRTLVTLLHLRAVQRAANRRLALTTELSDDGNRLLAPAREGADFIVSGHLISLLMTQISENRHLAAVFAELFDAEGHELYLRPAADYVRTGREVSFATVVASAGRRRECAVGYRSAAGSGTAPAHGVHLNPDKRQRIRFTDADRIIVLAES
ncbi:NAD-binding lipoprotein [Streptomyces sp. NPDC048606]|uniref:CASTOR/POLLUX-related putative ion channel n=1 Tax=Streptomyces sp. NPDC048606 TaxID=3154726 RepID=UPI0034232DC7